MDENDDLRENHNLDENCDLEENEPIVLMSDHLWNCGKTSGRVATS